MCQLTVVFRNIPPARVWVLPRGDALSYSGYGGRLGGPGTIVKLTRVFFFLIEQIDSGLHFKFCHVLIRKKEENKKQKGYYRVETGMMWQEYRLGNSSQNASKQNCDLGEVPEHCGLLDHIPALKFLRMHAFSKYTHMDILIHFG